MKVVCDACSAKYQIPDERVAGRKLKIRCRKCGGAIIIRGDLLVEPAAPEPQAAPVASDEWHVSIDGDQHGPYTTEQMTSMLAAGQLDWDVFVWREGLSDWEAAFECAPLVEVARAAGLSVPTDDEPTLAQEGPTSIVDRGDDAPTSMYTSDSFAPGDGLQPRARADFSRRADSSPELAAVSTGPSPASAFAPSGEPARVSPRVSLEDAMTGERNEDSVLFSMGNLRAQVAATTSSPPQRAGFASGEGSGLIDIRALAALAGTQSVQPPTVRTGLMPPAGSGDSQEDQLLRLAQQTGAFATVDSLAPIDNVSQASSPAVPIAIFSGAAIIAAAVFAAIYVTRDAAPAPLVEVAGQAAPDVAAAAEPTSPELALAEAEAPEAAEDEPEALEAAAEEEDEAEETEAEPTQVAAAPAAAKPRARPTPKRAALKAKRTAAAKKAAKTQEPEEEKKPATLDDILLGEKGDKADKPAAEPEPEKKVTAKEEPAPKAKEPAGDRSIDDLLDGAVTKKEAASLPDSPTRAQVLQAMKGIMPAVKACGEEGGATGKAVAAITVRGSTGKVTEVNVTGIQGSVGSCIARAVRKASFPQFAKASFSINYPFKL